MTSESPGPRAPREPPAGRRRSVFPGFADIGERRPPVVDALVALRRAEGRSQGDLARRMGTSQPAVARLEGGGTEARLSTLARYADALGHDLVWELRPRTGPGRPDRPEGSG